MRERERGRDRERERERETSCVQEAITRFFWNKSGALVLCDVSLSVIAASNECTNNFRSLHFGTKCKVKRPILKKTKF